jgi:NhaP-type Na+/H+ or K+/H+ antiporter
MPARLLAIGMPLTIALGTVIGVLVFPTMGLIGAAIVATILAPTDAALGQAVVSNPIVPSRIRGALGVESGLNDGIALPILLFLMSLYSADQGLPLWHLFFKGIGIAILVGVVVGAVTAVAIRIASRRSWIADSWVQISVVAVAFGTYVIADELGGSGFIAAYVAGHVFGTIGENATHASDELGENIGTILTMVSFLVFGAFILAPHPEIFTVRTVLFGVLSLTAIRMLPVAISMIGSRQRAPTIVYMGWFGPRGLASIVFAGVLVEASNIDSSKAIVAAVMVTVALSVFFHGATAPWGAERYGAWSRSAGSADAGE